jgi:hypothetical protein
MSNLYCSEDNVYIDGKSTDENAKRWRGGMSAPYETAHEDTGSLYRACVKTLGRCTGKMYVGNGKQVGWVFLKKNPEGSGCIETWIEVYVSPPVQSVSWNEPVFPKFSK